MVPATVFIYNMASEERSQSQVPLIVKQGGSEPHTLILCSTEKEEESGGDDERCKYRGKWEVNVSCPDHDSRGLKDVSSGGHLFHG